MKTIKRYTIEKNYMYHLYFSEDRFFVDYYKNTIIHSYGTEAAARKAIYYHFN